MSQPRASTDEESAPLLDNRTSRPHSQTFLDSLRHPPRQLTNLEKLLALGAVILLLLTSTFIGLFAGAESTLKRERKAGHGSGETVTRTATVTEIPTATTTVLGTTTVPAAPAPTGSPPVKLCTSRDCVLLSAGILASLNVTVDPCEDFYKFATEGWDAAHDIPADKGVFGSFNEVADGNKKVLLRVISGIPDKLSKDSGANERNLHKLKTVYSSCMDTGALNDVGSAPLIKMVDHLVETFGAFDPIPPPAADAVEAASLPEWSGAWSDDYELPGDLLEAADEADRLRRTRRLSKNKPTSKARDAISEDTDDVETMKSKSGFPAERRAKITKALAWLHSRGVEGLLNFAIEGDAGGPDSQIQSLWLYQEMGGLPSKEYYEEKPILDLYQSVITNILVLLAKDSKAARAKPETRGLIDEAMEMLEVEESAWPWPWPGDDDKSHSPSPPAPGRKESVEDRMEKLAAKVVTFERELVRAGADLEYIFNPHYAYNPYTTKKVEKSLPFIDLPTYLSTFAPRTFPANITVTYPPYLKAVTKLIKDVPDYVLSGYFATRLAMTYASALGPKVGIRQETRRLEEVLRGIKKGTEENRQDVCLGWVDNLVGFIAGKEFVDQTFSPEAKEEGTQIISSIVDAFYEKLPHIKWMDKESAEAAQLKAKSILPKVGYPTSPNTTDPASLERWYAGTKVTEEDFFGSVLSSILTTNAKEWLMLGRTRDRGSWEMYPQTVNAYYSPPDGEIVFPAGILQPPFYSHDWPTHLKYGAFGAVAAHELTHAFDNSGSQYDEHGRLRDWWTNSTVEAFEERAQCVAKQYSKYWVLDAEGKKVYVNGNLTNGEDIADSGLAQAYQAWQSSSASATESLKLPGLEEYSDDQLFFIAFARVWAQLIRPASAVSRVRTDPHSPNQWRTIGTLRNFAKFSEAFGCKVGSGMRPKKEDMCELW